VIIMTNKNLDNKILVAVDIGGTKMTVSLANKAGIMTRAYQPVRKTGENTAIYTQINELIDFLITNYNTDKYANYTRQNISAIGVSTCSPFAADPKNKINRVIVAPNLCGGLVENSSLPNNWKYIPLQENLENDFDNVEIDNDCISAIKAESLFGAARKEENAVYVTWSTGIGAGAIVDGRIITGKNGNASHLGHIYVSDSDRQCGCGMKGDLETLIQGDAIARDYCVALNKPEGTYDTKDVFEHYRSNGIKAIEIIDNAAKLFSRALKNCTSLLDTKVYIFGGSVFNDADVLMPLIKKYYFDSQDGFTALTEGTEFRLAGLGKYLGDMAALSLVMPKEWVANWQTRKPWENTTVTIKLDDEGKVLNTQY
jgi:glucokinase